jgi:alkylation response protein AidB-like acyl-CoA dehydrogenase
MTGASTSYADLQALRESLRAFLSKYSPESEVRRSMATDTGYDSQLWRRLAEELGLPGFAVPAEYGGSGFAATELQVVMEELGRALVCVPFLSSAVLATNVLLASGDVDACGELLPVLAAGTRTATLAATGEAGSFDADDVWGCAAEQSGTEHQITGRRTFVLDALTADVFLVTATTAAGAALLAVDASAAGVRRGALATLDETRKQGWVEFSGTPGRLIGSAGGADEILHRALVPSAVALAGEHVGGARRALEMAVEYAKVREQFGRVIGSFQAIKHKCADMLLSVEAATSTVAAAAESIDADDGDQDALAHLALSVTSEAFLFVATENIEVHGGIGFTWESAAHLYYKRAVAGTVVFGSPTAHRAQLLTAMGR